MENIDSNISLTDGTITIRPYREDDVDQLFEAVTESIPEVGAWMEWAHPDYDIRESREWVTSTFEQWEKGEAYSFSIWDAGTDRYLGGCGLNNINHTLGVANLGYWVRTSATRKGVATASTLLLAGFGAGTLGLNRMEIVVDVDNKASQRVAEKSGAAREGILRNRLNLYGKSRDAVMFSLIPQDLNR